MRENHTTYLQNSTILIVDDDPYVREGLCDILEYEQYNTIEAGDGKTALDAIAQESINLILLDLEMPRVAGMDVLRHTMDKYPEIPVVIISGKGTIRQAVEATKLGAYDFLEKPVDAQRTLLTVRNALEKATLQRQRNRFLDEARQRYQMVGSSLAMQRIYRLIDKAAAVSSRVLLLGESGTGKELIARAIHHNSPRAPGPFVAVNCAAIPEDLIESTLFGHERGAFTGAHAHKMGKFEQADGGTLFLDEIGDMSLMTQTKTLRVLEESRIERVGGTKVIPVNVRVIAATNKDLEAELEAGNFREDLFYRLNVITLRVPPLRERRDDIVNLVNHFLELYSLENELPAKKLEVSALTILTEYEWPGNIRQLRNVVERLMALSEGEVITARDVAGALNRLQEMPTPTQTPNLREAREQFERDYILKALINTSWEIKEAAMALGIDRSHLWKKMQRYRIDKPR